MSFFWWSVVEWKGCSASFMQPFRVNGWILSIRGPSCLVKQTSGDTLPTIDCRSPVAKVLRNDYGYTNLHDKVFAGRGLQDWGTGPPQLVAWEVGPLDGAKARERPGKVEQRLIWGPNLGPIQTDWATCTTKTTHSCMSWLQHPPFSVGEWRFSIELGARKFFM